MKPLKLEAEPHSAPQVHASTAMRASQTAQIACEEAGYDVKKIIQSPQIVEMSQGGWEQQERREVYTDENLKRLRANPWEFRPPGISPDGAHGESHRDIEGRILEYIENKILPKRTSEAPSSVSDDSSKSISHTKEAHSIPVVYIFCHGLLIKAALRGIMAMSPRMTHRLEVDNTAMTEIRYYTQPGDFGGWHLVTLNDRQHLRGLQTGP